MTEQRAKYGCPPIISQVEHDTAVDMDELANRPGAQRWYVPVCLACGSVHHHQTSQGWNMCDDCGHTDIQ